jgi:aspartyl-tRNA(Asn)/glutamyl-tRNA(Gln) amidotransferase subunit A
MAPEPVAADAPTIAAAREGLAAGTLTSAGLVEECLARTRDPTGEGARAFTLIDEESADAVAAAMDAMRAAGVEPSRFAGIPVAVKDLFDVRHQVTRAGSVALDEGPAAADADAVAAWRRAGLVLLGRTNMTEFAYSGLGINPHYGTPLNPWDRGRGRIPGGSTSGGAVAVADGMALGALGSDTGGSCRIPAALCGLVGLKPTQARVSRRGMVPLSTSLDAVGVIGRTVACCAELEALLRGEELKSLPEPPRPPRLAIPRGYLFEGVDDIVGAAFERAVGKLAAAGAELVETEFGELDEIPGASAAGGFPAAESFAWHRELITARGDAYDPRVLVRIRRGETQPASDLLALREWRAGFKARIAARLAGFDGFLAPTVPVVAPPLDVFEDDEEYARLNLLILRNPTVVNLLDGCAISVPMGAAGEGPSGLMLAGLGGTDDEMLRIANWMEARL